MAQARRLQELLQEPQEPFYVDTFLIERGYSTNLLEAQESLSLCWPRNSSKNQRRLRTDDFSRKSGGFGKGFLSKFLYRKLVQRTIKCDRKALKDGMASQNHERILNSCRFVEELEPETKNHSPVSVLEMHSYVASSDYSNDKEEKPPKLLSLIDSPKKAFNILQELLKLAYDPSTNYISESAQNDLKEQSASDFEDWDLISEASTTIEEGSSFSFDGEHLEAVREIVITELENSLKNWDNLKFEMSREFRTEIENVIFEEIIEELILDFLKPNCTNERCKIYS